MIDIHIRISRKLVFWLVLLLVVLPVIWLLLQTLGGNSSQAASLSALSHSGL
ncbi:MAG: hypothetical protein QOE13_747 [Gaiellaceae bacterium]|nr:hypothetical protein [Gaiellaceae bacterium]